MSQHYQVAVVGGGISALLTANLCAKRGLRVLLVDQGELSTVHFDHRADLLLDDEHSTVMRLVHDELGLQDQVRRQRKAPEPGLQVLLPKTRMELLADSSARHSLWSDSLGLSAEEVQKAEETLKQLAQQTEEALLQAPIYPGQGFLGRRSAIGWAKKHGELHQRGLHQAFSKLPFDLVQIWLSAVPYLTYLLPGTPEELSTAVAARTLHLFLQGYFEIDGESSLRTLLQERAEGLGVEIIRGAVERLRPSGKTFELRMAGAKAEYSTDLLVDASSDLSGLQEVPSKSQGKNLAQALQSAHARGFLHRIRVELDREVVPGPLGHRALLVSAEPVEAAPWQWHQRSFWLTQRPLPDDSPRLEITLEAAVSSALAHTGALSEVEAGLKERLRHLVPFLEEGKPQWKASKSQQLPPPLKHNYLDTELDSLTGLGGLACKTPLKNAFVAGPQVLPGLGSEGLYFTALQAADYCAHHHGGPKPPANLSSRSK